MLPWLRSAPYPALCPCEPLGPVGDMQAVSYDARSRQYSPLLPAVIIAGRYQVHTYLVWYVRTWYHTVVACYNNSVLTTPLIPILVRAHAQNFWGGCSN